MSDVLVVGAGVFGVWTAAHLTRAGCRVTIVDAYGAASSRASSGGESRLIRMGYGDAETYTRWAQRSLVAWRALADESPAPLFYRTGVLWLAHPGDGLAAATFATLARCGVPTERLGPDDLARRFPQIGRDGLAFAILEPESGVLMARRAVQTLLARLTSRDGIRYQPARLEPPAGRGRLTSVATTSGERLVADRFVFACGPWLPALFPDIVGPRIQPTRQEVLFFGTPAGSVRFASPALPAWVEFSEGLYGAPDLEGRGLKVGIDRHGPPFDPDTGDRLADPASVVAVRTFLARRFPALAEAPLVESRVCQYENTSGGDFLIDRHPELDNVWLVGGGSGHGFKHGPAVGEYVAGLLNGTVAPDPRFGLATKRTVWNRAVY